MNLFSISQLARYSGVKPHTIRVWEQRYHALHPTRSEGNTRYYDNKQLRRLLNIVSLADSDRKISTLCEMSDNELFALINESVDNKKDKTSRSEYFISQLIAAGLSFDEQHFEKIFSSCVYRYGMHEAYTEVIYPMLERIGLMWAADNIPPANEHFISNIIRQKLFTAIDSLPPPKAEMEKWLLFLQEDEFHEIGLLFSSYLIRQAGRQVLYLGGDVPFESLIKAIKTTRPQYLLLFLVHRDEPQIVGDYLKQLSQSFTGKKIFISGDEKLIGELKPQRKVHWLKNVEDLTKALQG